MRVEPTQAIVAEPESALSTLSKVLGTEIDLSVFWPFAEKTVMIADLLFLVVGLGLLYWAFSRRRARRDAVDRLEVGGFDGDEPGAKRELDRIDKLKRTTIVSAIGGLVALVVVFVTDLDWFGSFVLGAGRVVTLGQVVVVVVLVAGVCGILLRAIYDSWYTAMDVVSAGFRAMFLVFAGLLLWAVIAALFETIWSALDLGEQLPIPIALLLLLVSFWMLYMVLWPRKPDPPISMKQTRKIIIEEVGEAVIRQWKFDLEAAGEAAIEEHASKVDPWLEQVFESKLGEWVEGLKLAPVDDREAVQAADVQAGETEKPTNEPVLPEGVSESGDENKDGNPGE